MILFTTYDWNVIPLNDSTSQVTVLVTDVENSLSNKIAIPFSETDFEKRTKTYAQRPHGNTQRACRRVLK